MEMVGRESVLATWNLRMQGGGGEVRKCLANKDGVREIAKERSGRAECVDCCFWFCLLLTDSGMFSWLAHAELSSFARSAKLLPQYIYLSHQFSFHTLGEDCHALIRHYQLDISGHKIDVRKEVQVSAYSAGSGESFVEGFSSPPDVRNRTLSSSFDKPLASALAGGLDYHHSPSVLPMLLNGMPGAQSFCSSIPIRTMAGLGDGMSEDLGRIGREINRVRSPRLRPYLDSTMSTSVPLEFDEEDEGFMSRDS